MPEATDTTTIAIAARDRARVPYLAEYMGFWAMEATSFGMLAGKAAQIRLDAHMEHVATKRVDDLKAENGTNYVHGGYRYEVTDGVAVVDVEGSLMKHVSSLDEATSTVMLRATVRKMMMDESVKAVIFRIDSPGGTVAGTYQLADDIRMLAERKPCYAYADDLMASAAYAIACFAKEISCGDTAIVGSIGTYGVVYDYSGWFKKQGIRAVLLSSGGVKGAGTPGTKITRAQRDEWQKTIDELNAKFIDTVAAGRRMKRERAESLATGQVWVGKAAKDMGLVDHVESFDDLFNRVVAQVKAEASQPPSNTRPQPQRQSAEPIASQDNEDGPDVAAVVETTAQAEEGVVPESSASGPIPDPVSDGEQHMSTPNPATPGATNNPASPNSTAPAGDAAPRAATLQELRAACPGASADFYMAQLDANATVATAQAAHMAALVAENSKLRTGGGTQQQGRPAGVKPIASRPANAAAETESSPSGDGMAEFNAAVEQEMERQGANVDRRAAIKRVCQRNPELHRSYLKSTNKRGMHGRIDSKFDDADE